VVTTPWKQAVMLGSGRSARVVVTPAGHTVATCQIVLDAEPGPPKTRVLAQQDGSAPGQPVTCQATMLTDQRFR
jgi:hypothetical protein